MPEKQQRRYPRLKRAALVGMGLFIAAMGVSYVRALRAPNSPGWDLRTAEWVRENHLGWALDAAEWVWFSVHGPTVAELQATELSTFPEPFARVRADFRGSAEPKPIAVVFDKARLGEGVWQGIGSTINGVSALRCTSFRPFTGTPDVSVAVARFTPELTRFVLVPGTRDPGGDWRWHGGIPQDQRADLLAAFNAGFQLRDAHGGLYVEGTVARTLVVGAASLVIDQNGKPNIVAWTGDSMLTPDVVSVRQNLELIVAEGKVSAELLAGRNAPGMWRSGLGIARDGALFYVAGHGLTLGLLADALKHVGAVRAMQLDIHQQWPSFHVYQPAARGRKLVATKLLTNMRHRADRYLAPDDRDFVAAFIR